MHFADSPLRGRLALGVALLALLAVALVAPHPAHAAYNDNNDCRGSFKAGAKDPLGLNDNLVTYKFACAQPITAYSLIFPAHEIDYTDTEVFGADRTTGQVVGTDSFSCNGDLPGYGINCVGTYGGNYDVISANVDLSTQKLCDEPRVEVLATVAYASYAKAADGTPTLTAGVPTVTTNAAGTFSLGRPKGCPRTTGKITRLIPPDTDTSADTPGDPTAGPLG